MRRPGYREAVEWIALNDDCEWLKDCDDYGPIISVSAAMIRDLFDVTDDRLFADIRRAVTRIEAQGRQRSTL